MASIEVNTTSPSAPQFDALPVSNNTTPTFTGTGEENATVTILIDDNGSGIPDTVLGTAVVNGAGTWSFGPVAALSDGIYAIVIYQTDPAGNISGSTSASVTIDTTAPVAPTFDALAATTNTTPTITGTGEVGATVTVLADLATDPNGVDGTPETEITDPANRPVVQADGMWEFDSNVTLPEGTIALSATQTDLAGNESTVGTSSVDIDLTPPDGHL